MQRRITAFLANFAFHYRTYSILNWLMVYAVNTELLTSLLCIVCVVAVCVSTATLAAHPLIHVTLTQRITEPENFVFIGSKSRTSPPQIYTLDFTNIVVFFPLSSLYTNALLGSLNARDWFRNNKDPVSIPLGPLGSSTGHSHRSGFSLAHRDAVGILYSASTVASDLGALRRRAQALPRSRRMS